MMLLYWALLYLNHFLLRETVATSLRLQRAHTVIIDINTKFIITLPTEK